MEEIKARDYARSCGLSETHMRRIFSEYTNMSPSEYLNVVRINKACELLAHGNDSIEDISPCSRLSGPVNLPAEFPKNNRTFPQRLAQTRNLRKMDTAAGRQ